MARYRKKPVEIDAIQWQGGEYQSLERFCGHNWARADARDVSWTAPDDGERVVLWNTLESQWLLCPKGHWVIRGLQGELYPCDPEVFAKSYEPA
jgi:hypothetical protein